MGEEDIAKGSLLERAISIAVEAHAGQRDKAGEPYILHPIRVMLAMKSEEERAAAILHDVLEDCPDWTYLEMQERGITHPVLDALDHLTRRKAEDYTAFIDRCARNPMARGVKLEDLRDNMNLARIPDLTDADLARADKYQAAYSRLKFKHNRRQAIRLPK